MGKFGIYEGILWEILGFLREFWGKFGVYEGILWEFEGNFGEFEEILSEF